MNDREKIREQLSAYLDGESSPSERRRIEAALKEDAELGGELDEMRAMRSLLRTLPVERVDEDFASRVMSAAERGHLVGAASPDERRRALPWVRRLATAAVLLVALGVGVIVTVTLWLPGLPNEKVASNSGSVGELARNGARQAKSVERAAPGKKAATEGASVGELARNGARQAKSVERAEKTATHDKFAKVEEKSSRMASSVPAPKGAAEAVESGKVARHDEKPAGSSSVLTGGGSRSLGVAEVYKEVIYTDQLAVAQRQVADVLRRNGIEPVAEGVPATGRAATAVAGARGRANLYQADLVAPDRVEIVAFVTPEQLADVRTELKAIRMRQRVSQSAFQPREKAKLVLAKSRRSVPLKATLKGPLVPSAAEVRPQPLAELRKTLTARADVSVSGEGFQPRSSAASRRARPAKAIMKTVGKARSQPAAIRQKTFVNTTTAPRARRPLKALVIMLNYRPGVPQKPGGGEAPQAGVPGINKKKSPTTQSK